jgi:hypothetical protein
MKLRNIALAGLASLSIGCATIPKDQDKFYTLFFTPLPDGLTNEYDTDGDGYGDYKMIYELMEMGKTSFLELRAIQEDKNRDRVYTQDETTILPTKQLEFEKI